jgi:DNA-directed RNA polymerase sigma subunit (sigma70/sigma32)
MSWEEREMRTINKILTEENIDINDIREVNPKEGSLGIGWFGVIYHREIKGIKEKRLRRLVKECSWIREVDHTKRTVYDDVLARAACGIDLMARIYGDEMPAVWGRTRSAEAKLYLRIRSDGEFFKQLQEIIDELLQCLIDRDRYVVRKRFGLDDGRRRSLEGLGQEFGVTRERVRQVEVRAIRKIRERSGIEHDEYLRAWLKRL